MNSVDGSPALDAPTTAGPSPGTGRLFLMPTPLDHGCATQQALDQVLPQQTIAIAAQITHWIGENAKSTRQFLKRIDGVLPLLQPLQQQNIVELPRDIHKKGDHDPRSQQVQRNNLKGLLEPARRGHDMGLITEAGMPAIADPGSSVVRGAHELGIEVVPLVGPCSLLLALAASGLNGQDFAFVGYLPQDSEARRQRIRELEALALKTGQTQLFIETPYRNRAMLDSLKTQLHGQTRLAVSIGLTLPQALTRSGLAQHWRDTPRLSGAVEAAALKWPAVFLIGR
jgi:16S rRNA (cytidine1402-2'-O)-methyltransferase